MFNKRMRNKWKEIRCICCCLQRHSKRIKKNLNSYDFICNMCLFYFFFLIFSSKILRMQHTLTNCCRFNLILFLFLFDLFMEWEENAKTYLKMSCHHLRGRIFRNCFGFVWVFNIFCFIYSIFVWKFAFMILNVSFSFFYFRTRRMQIKRDWFLLKKKTVLEIRIRYSIMIIMNIF